MDYLYGSVAKIHNHRDVCSKPDVYERIARLICGNSSFRIATLLKNLTVFEDVMIQVS